MNGLSLLAVGELFVVDVTRIQKVARDMAFTPVPAAPDEVVGIANFKGGIVTLISLSEMLGRGRSAKAVHAVIFKPFEEENSQMGLLIDSPGDLITIDDAEILPPRFAAQDEDRSFISGFAEVGGKFYRIIDIDLVRNKLAKRGNERCDFND